MKNKPNRLTNRPGKSRLTRQPVRHAVVSISRSPYPQLSQHNQTSQNSDEEESEEEESEAENDGTPQDPNVPRKRGAAKKRFYNSCHSCKCGVAPGVEHARCSCGIMYCARPRCAKRLSVEWNVYAAQLAAGHPCIHCVAFKEGSTYECPNSNCKQKKEKGCESRKYSVGVITSAQEIRIPDPYLSMQPVAARAVAGPGLTSLHMTGSHMYNQIPQMHAKAINPLTGGPLLNLGTKNSFLEAMSNSHNQSSQGYTVDTMLQQQQQQLQLQQLLQLLQPQSTSQSSSNFAAAASPTPVSDFSYPPLFNHSMMDNNQMNINQMNSMPQSQPLNHSNMNFDPQSTTINALLHSLQNSNIPKNNGSMIQPMASYPSQSQSHNSPIIPSMTSSQSQSNPSFHHAMNQQQTHQMNSAMRSTPPMTAEQSILQALLQQQLQNSGDLRHLMSNQSSNIYNQHSQSPPHQQRSQNSQNLFGGISALPLGAFMNSASSQSHSLGQQHHFNAPYPQSRVAANPVPSFNQIQLNQNSHGLMNQGMNHNVNKQSVNHAGLTNQSMYQSNNANLNHQSLAHPNLNSFMQHLASSTSTIAQSKLE